MFWQHSTQRDVSQSGSHRQVRSGLSTGAFGLVTLSFYLRNKHVMSFSVSSIVLLNFPRDDTPFQSSQFFSSRQSWSLWVVEDDAKCDVVMESCGHNTGRDSLGSGDYHVCWRSVVTPQNFTTLRHVSQQYCINLQQKWEEWWIVKRLFGIMILNCWRLGWLNFSDICCMVLCCLWWSLTFISLSVRISFIYYISGRTTVQWNARYMKDHDDKT